MKTDVTWSKSYSHDIHTTPQVIWQALANAAHWNLWNPGVKSIQMEGNFTTGTRFSMELPDGTIIPSILIEVNAPQRFIDESWVGKTRIWVEHRIEALTGDQCRVIYIANTQGPDAQAIGEAVSADFPDVLAGLAKHVSEKKAV